MRLNFYEDPGHGWLAVPLPLLERLGLLDSISPYSYMRGMLAHLEEDCDYERFWAAAQRAGLQITIRTTRTDHRSRIRNYCQFDAHEARRVLSNARSR